LYFFSFLFSGLEEKVSVNIYCLVQRSIGGFWLGSQVFIFCCSWDEWVGMDRLMKHTEENMRKKHALDEKHGIDKNPKAPRGPLAKSKSTNGQTVLFCSFIASIPMTSCVSCL